MRKKNLTKNIDAAKDRLNESITIAKEGKKKYGKMLKQFGITMALIIFVFYFVQNFISIYRIKNAVADNLAKTYIELAKEEADKVGFFNSLLLSDLRVYSENEEIISGDIDRVKKFIIYQNPNKNKYFRELFFCDSNGNGYFHDGRTENMKGRSFYSLMTSYDVFVSDMDKLPTGAEVYYVCRKVIDSKGNFVGYFGGAVNISSLYNQINDVKVTSDSECFILTNSGEMLSEATLLNGRVDLSMEKNWKGMPEFVESIAKSTNGFSYVKNPQGKKILMIHYAIPSSGWFLVIAVPYNQIRNSLSFLTGMQTSLSIAFGLIILACFLLLLFWNIKPLKIVSDSIEKIAAGNADLTQKVEIKSNNEIGKLGESFNRFMEKLHDIVSQVKASKNDLQLAKKDLQNSIDENASSVNLIVEDINKIDGQVISQANSVEETGGAIEQISSNIDSLNHMINSQSAAVTEASVAVEEMIGNIGSVNKSVVLMADSFEELTREANEGISKQTNVNTRILDIDTQSKTLQDANKVISAIASQTNLLAMNAAIEAAHAGDAGRGFSVVADEIRKLSETSSGQTKKIREELKKIQSSINDVVEASKASAASFGIVNDKISETHQLVMQIQSAMDEQQSGSKQIGNALRTMNDTTVEVKESSKEMGNGSRLILEQVRQLKDATGAIKKTMSEITGNAGLIKDTSSKLEEISGTVSRSVEHIGEQIDLFTV